MSQLDVFDAADVRCKSRHREGDAIAAQLARIGVLFERWEAKAQLADQATDDEILRAYAEPVRRLKAQYGFATADVIAVTPDHPQRHELRRKFLDEHTHSEYEVRYFVDGRGLFYIHSGPEVHAILCEKGDLISVPAGATHWFDMGEKPSLRCIRLFTNPEGWVARYTQDPIAARFPMLDDILGTTR